MKKSGKGPEYIFVDPEVKMIPTIANNLMQPLIDLHMENEG